MPSSKFRHEEFVPISIPTDFFVVHSFNKNSSNLCNQSPSNLNFDYKNTVQEIKGSNTHSFFKKKQFFVDGEATRIEFLSNSNVFNGIRQKAFKKEQFIQPIEKARIGKLSVNHIYLINKCMKFLVVIF